MTATLASRAGTTHAAETLAQSAWAPTPFPAQVGGQRACLPVLPGPTGPVTYPSAAHRRGVRACARGDLPIRCQPEDHSPPGLVSSSAPWQPRCGKPALVDSETARFHRAPWPVGRRVLPRSLPRARSRRLTRLVSRVRIGVLGGRRGGAVAGAHHHGSRWEGSEGGGCAGGAHQRTVAAATRLPPTTPLPPSLRRSRCDRRRRGVAAQTVGGICIGASRSFSLPCLDVFYVAWTRPPRVAPFPPFARALVAGAAGVPHSGAPLPPPPPPSVGAVLAVGRWRPAVSDTLCLPFPPSGASRPPTGGYPVWLYAPPVGRVSFYPLPKRSCAGAADCVGPPPAPSLPLLGEAGLGRAAGRGGDRVGSVDGGHSVQNRLARVW